MTRSEENAVIAYDGLMNFVVKLDVLGADGYEYLLAKLNEFIRFSQGMPEQVALAEEARRFTLYIYEGYFPKENV